MGHHSKTSLLRALVVCFCMLSTGTRSSGQQSAVYNINKYNGLSSNHVYCTLVDRMGYLWLGTTDGVYRYNGYSLRKYDYKDGLPNVDVWNLYEDKQGRIWLRSIAQQIGYIKSNKFFRVYKKTENPYLEIYPETLVEIDSNTIAFFNNTTDKSQTYIYCVIENDTLTSKNIFEGNYNTMPQLQSGYIYHTLDSFLYLFNLRKTLKSVHGEYGLPEKTVLTDINITKDIANKRIYAFGSTFLAYYVPAGTTLSFVNVHTGKSTIYNVRDLLRDREEQVNFCFVYRNSFTCITRNGIITLDTLLNINIIQRLDSVIPSKNISGFTSTSFLDSRIWGNVLASSDNGIYINYNTAGNLHKLSPNIDGFTFLNNKNDTDGYWWNNSSRELATVNKGMIRDRVKLPGVYGIKKVIRYDTASEIILSVNNTYWLYNGKSAAPINHGIDKAVALDSVKHNYDANHGTFTHSNDLFVADNKDLYFLGISTMGSKKIRINKSKSCFYYSTYHNQRFRNIVFNRPYNTIICYSTDKIFLYNPDTEFRLQLNQQALEQLGFNAIEKVMPDNNGNLFIKDYNSLKVFNLRKGTFRNLLENYNLKQAKAEIIGNNLFIAGNFGVLKADIHPNGNITVINTFQNTKYIYYEYIHDVQFAADNVLLKTDRGVYVYNYTSDSNAHVDDYRIIADDNDNLISLKDNDTLGIRPGTSVINLDVIKPTGTGNLRIEYALNKSQYQSSENQLILPAFNPGSYNTISLIASDDSWRSKPLKFTIYIKPKWWQTQTAKRIIFVLSLLAFIGFVYLVVVMTRRMVNRNNERRNQRRELELKSIYSQINPHFIFNSLSTAQYFVKKNRNKEAFDHINQFSDLLRAYIKSSRAKYITIAEEIENLENYLELQLTRFEEKFSYSITVDSSVNLKKVKIPSLLLQPLVENALNHGIFHSETKGSLNISFKIDERDRDTLVCIVDDNGVGRQKSKELRGKIIRKAHSYGTILIKELIDTFNKYEKINIEIEYIDKQLPLTGTTVIIRIKNFTHAQ